MTTWAIPHSPVIVYFGHCQNVAQNVYLLLSRSLSRASYFGFNPPIRAPLLGIVEKLGKVIKGKGNRIRSPVGCGHNLLLSADTEKMRNDTNFKLQRVQRA